MIDRRRVEGLVGETVREIGILLFVFAPLDAIYQGSRGAAIAIPLALGGLFFMAGGIILEARSNVARL